MPDRGLADVKLTDMKSAGNCSKPAKGSGKPTSTRSGVKEVLGDLQLGSGGFEAAPSRCVDLRSRGGSGGGMCSAVASYRITGGFIQV